jgi:hypothetical protein
MTWLIFCGLYIIGMMFVIAMFYALSERRDFTDEDEANDLLDQAEYLERMK